MGSNTENKPRTTEINTKIKKKKGKEWKLLPSQYLKSNKYSGTKREKSNITIAILEKLTFL